MKSASPEGSCLTLKQKTRLERLARDKHSSLLQEFVNYGRKKLYNIGPWYLMFWHLVETTGLQLVVCFTCFRNIKDLWSMDL
jgi:hypothetical protein